MRDASPTRGPGAYHAFMRALFTPCAALAVGACIAAPQPTPIPEMPSPPPSSVASQPMNTDLPAVVQSMLPALRADAARRSGAGAVQLGVVSVEEVTWADGALGCAQPGQTYTLALVPGWRIVLAAPQGPPQHYHASRRGAWVWCPAERSRTPPGALQRM